MIEKYTRPAMGAIWSEERKIALWLKVEIAVCEAWAEEGVVPAEALPAIRRATVDLERMREIERETEHDVIAFLRAASETVGEEARWIHLGLTSSDVIDTALSLQVLEAIDLMLADIDSTREAVGALALVIPSALLEWGRPVHWSPRLAWALGFSILLAGILATFIWFRLVTRIGAVKAAAFHFLSPPFGVAIAALALGERFGWTDVVGSLIVAAGILLVQLARVQPRPAKDRPGP